MKYGRAVFGAVCASLLASGCGGGGDDDARIDRERFDAAAAAVQAERIRQLKEEVDDLKSEKPRTATKTKTVERQAPAAPAAAAVSDSAESSQTRTFHAPSGNVSCAITTAAARCTVAAAGITFGFDGGPATKRSGSELPRSAGSRADWGTSVSLGDVTCTIPRQNEPRGITCVDGSTGHGFEASRRPDRQQIY